MGVVVDFEALKPALKKILGEFHETSFNNHPEFQNARKNPSTEHIAKLIYDRLSAGFKSPNAQIVKVTVFETPDACASYCAANSHA